VSYFDKDFIDVSEIWSIKANDAWLNFYGRWWYRGKRPHCSGDSRLLLGASTSFRVNAEGFEELLVA